MRTSRLSAIFLLLSIDLLAASRTWTGATNNLWTVPGNWGGTAPVAGDGLSFPVAPNLTNTNDFPANTAFTFIFFTACNYVLSGNAIDLAGGIGSNVICTDTLQMPIRLTASQQWFYLGGPLHVTGPIDLNGQTLTLTDFGGVGSFIEGPISGTRAIVKDGPTSWTLSGASTFNGPVLVLHGTVILGAPQTLPGGTSVTLAGNLDVNGQTQAIGSLDGSGNVSLGSGGAFTIQGGTTTFSGPFTGTGSVVHSGGTLTLKGVSTYSGSYANSAGVTLLNAGTLPVPYTQSGGAFGISSGGTVGATTINGGRITAGNGGSGPGNTGSLALSAAATFDQLINGTSLSFFGNLHVTGTVNLGGSTFNLFGSGAGVVAGSTFTIIDNDGTDPVVGTFAGLPNASVIPVGPGGFKYAITYNGGSGNDVVLTATEPTNIPALDPRALLVLAVALAAIAVIALRR
jgi:autotransporter-associated beta strand protein